MAINIAKGNCPVCIKFPIEELDDEEYGEKYPANNILTLGNIKINICEHHLKELRDVLNEKAT